jgi:RNA polymerase sigma factor (sigma-70 family)
MVMTEQVMSTGDADQELLARWSTHSDEEAFAQLMRRHAPLVYGAAQRVLMNAALAEEATQETFYRLLREGRRVRQSLAGWLHTTATRVAIDLRRSEMARRRRELAPRQPVERWADLAPQLDEALAALPQPQRDLIVTHYLQATPQRQMAQQLGLSLTTLHRQIQHALASLKIELEKRGCVLAACPLATLLPQAHVAAVPAPLAASLGKIHLAAGIAATPAPVAAPSAGLIALGLAGAALTILLAIIACLLLAHGASITEPANRALPGGSLVESPPWPSDWPDLAQGRYLRIAGIETPGPSDVIVLFEHPDSAAATLAAGFADGHVQWLKREQLLARLEQQAGGDLQNLTASLSPVDRLESP